MRGTSWRGWRWLDRVLLPLSIAGSYAAWVYPVLIAHVSDPGVEARYTGVAFWLCLGTLLAARLLGRLAGQYRRSGLIVLSGGLVPLLAFAIWVLVRLHRLSSPSLADGPLRHALIAGAACAVLLWWRGTRLAYDDHHEETSRTFSVGAVALVMLVLVSHLQTRLGVVSPSAYTNWIAVLISLHILGAIVVTILGFLGADARKVVSWGEGIVASLAVVLAAMWPTLPAPETLAGPILLFCFSGLVARALLGLSWVLNTQRGRDGMRLHVDWVWLGIILGMVTGAVVLSVLVGQILAPKTILSALAWLWRTVVPLVWVLGLILSAVLWLMIELVSFLMSRWPIEWPRFEPPSMEEMERAAGTGLGLPALEHPAVKMLLVGIVVAVVVWLLYRAAKRLPGVGLPPVGVSEQRTRGLGLVSLREILQDLFAHLWRGTTALFLPLGAGERTRHIVRRIYQNVLYRAAALDAPRERAQTPRQYAETIRAFCPEREGDLEQLTQIYERARYGPEPPTESQATAAGEAGKRIETMLQDAKPAQTVPQDTLNG